MLYRPVKLEVTSKNTFARKVLNEWLKPLLIALACVLVINLFFPRYAVLGYSMEPGLHENDRLFVSNVDVMTNSISRGEIVVLYAPGDNEVVVKRVIGLPGETVEIYGGVVRINGVVLHESYIREAPRFRGRWEVGENEYFVLGDNRNASRDSSEYGPINVSRISGVVKFRFWPLNSFSVFQTPEY
jgi:signal peptidase I